MATNNRSTSTSPKRKSGGTTRAKPKPKRAASRSRSSSNSKPAASTRSSSDRQSQNENGVVATLKNGVGKAKGPAVVVGAAAAGLAGGLVLKGRRSRRKVLGVPLPRVRTPDVDVKSLVKTVGDASKRFGKTTKSVSKDIERVGDQAERIGKVLD
jgi:hypothetical protein